MSIVRRQNIQAKGSHMRVEQIDRDSEWPNYYHAIRLDGRRVVDSSRNESQIEIAIEKQKHESRRTTSTYASMILTPAQSRALARAICPEVFEALEIATATVELHTGNGARSNPPTWPRNANGDIDYEAVSEACRLFLREAA
jgi:hypothetical protein